MCNVKIRTKTWQHAFNAGKKVQVKERVRWQNQNRERDKERERKREINTGVRKTPCSLTCSPITTGALRMTASGSKRVMRRLRKHNTASHKRRGRLAVPTGPRSAEQHLFHAPQTA